MYSILSPQFETVLRGTTPEHASLSYHVEGPGIEKKNWDGRPTNRDEVYEVRSGVGGSQECVRGFFYEVHVWITFGSDFYTI